MNRISQVILISYICFIVFVFIEFSEANKTQRRYKRYLSFRNISHLFIRFNFKANMVKWNQIFAQAIGFRMNWDDPPDSLHPYHHLNRRTVYNNMEILLNRNNLLGFHCVRRAICELDQINQPKGLYLKILKIMFRNQSIDTDKWHKYTEQDCQLSSRGCPFSMLEVSPYTDL